MSYGGYPPPPPSGGYGSPVPPPVGGYGSTQPPGGYGAPYGAPPGPPGYGARPGGYSTAPPGANPQLWSWFSAVDADRSGQITAQELERALLNGDWTPFDIDTVKMLMSIFDTDRTGTINFNEFAGLWKYIEDWKNAFRVFDRDRSGTIDHQELTDALTQFGYNLNPQLITQVQKKYGIEASTTYVRHGPPPGITFDRFVRACVAIKQLTDAFRRQDTDGDGWIQISYDQFMSTVLSLP